MNTDIVKRVEKLEREFAQLKDPTWLTLPEFCSFASLNRDRVLSEIKQAELAVAQRKTPKLKRGEDYYNAASDNSNRASWRIHKFNFIKSISG